MISFLLYLSGPSKTKRKYIFFLMLTFINMILIRKPLTVHSTGGGASVIGPNTR